MDARFGVGYIVMSRHGIITLVTSLLCYAEKGTQAWNRQGNSKTKPKQIPKQLQPTQTTCTRHHVKHERSSFRWNHVKSKHNLITASRHHETIRIASKTAAHPQHSNHARHMRTPQAPEAPLAGAACEAHGTPLPEGLSIAGDSTEHTARFPGG